MIAVDSVDVGSVPNLRVGERMAVTYNKSNPRDARLAGTRTWRWKEWVELGEYAVLGIIALAAISLLGKVIGARWRRAVRPSSN